jgi:hypothetical protein
VSVAWQAMSDPYMSQKITKLVAAGIVQMR